MDSADLSRFDAALSRLQESLHELETQEWDHHHDHTEKIGHLTGQLTDLPRLQDRIAKACEDLGYLRGQMPLVCDELRALRRTVDDLLLARGGPSPRRKAAAGNSSRPDGPAPGR
jgi:hypothetical protein